MVVNAQDPTLTKELNKIINELILRGLMPKLNTDEKQQIVKQVLINLESVNFKATAEDLKKPEIRQAIGMACKAECLGIKNPALGMKFDYTLFFKPKKELTLADEKKLTEDIKNLFKEMLKLKMGKKKLDPKEEQALDKAAELLAKKMLQKECEYLAQHKGITNTVAGMLDSVEEFKRMMYGVGAAGEVFKPVLGEPFGEQWGIQDLATVGDNFMAEVNSPDPGKADPIGVHMLAIMEKIANGDLSEELENQLGIPDTVNEPPKAQSTIDSTYHSPTPFDSMKTGPKPSGTIDKE